ncbi:MAG: hypothetical protein M1479_10435 [Actinobacteria bacterium]|nr:hypothetical protein [Actinomycetota bacterium]
MFGNSIFSYRTIITGLRPPKIVTFIDKNDKDWIDLSIKIIEFYSQCWGGNYNLIVPTDGKKIDSIFLEILKIYDPDYAFIYNKTLDDIKFIDQKKYQEIIDEQYVNFIKNNKKIEKNSFLELFEKRATLEFITNFNISKKEINKLAPDTNPFELDFNIITAGFTPQWPLTHIAEILYSTKLVGLIDFQIESEKIFKLLCYSKLGISDWVIKLKDDDSYQDQEKNKFFNNLKRNVKVKKISSDKFYEFLELIYQKTIIENDFIAPFCLTMLNLGTYRPINYFETQDPIVIVVGNEIDDFCLYYNLSKLKKDVFWLPFSSINDGNLKGFMTIISEILFGKTHSNRNKKIFFVSNSINDENLKKFRELYIKNKFIKTKIEKLISKKELVEILPYIYKIFESNNYRNIYVEQFFSNKSINFINTPIPKTEHFKLNKIDTLDFRWISEIIIGINKNTENDSRYLLPRKPILSKYIFESATDFTQNELIRITNEGIAYLSPFLSVGSMRDYVENIVSKLKLKLLEPFEIFKIIFKSVGMDIKYSDKGSYLNESIRKFGSINEIANNLKDKKILKLFNYFTKDKQTDENKEFGIFLASDKRRYMSFDDFKQIVGLNTKKLIDNYISKGIIHRGLIFKCSKCKNTDWYSIKEISNTFICKRCSNEELYKIDNWELKDKSNEPSWSYKLDEVIYQGFRHNMATTILTLFKLFNDSKKSFIYIPEINICKENNNEKTKEIDICCISDGEIFIGECTIENRIGNQQKEVEKLKFLKYIANTIGAKKIILSTFEKSWSDEFNGRIKNIIPKISEIFTHKDLIKKYIL